MAENRDMSGVLFRNHRKVKETHPDYTGSCKVGGKDYYVSAWIKEANGKKYFSMAYKEDRSNKNDYAQEVTA